MPYSLDLRERVVAAVENGMKKTQACKLFNIGRQTLYNWLELKKEQGRLTHKDGCQKGHSHAIKDLDAFRNYVDQHLDFTQEEMAQHYSVCKKTIGRAIKKIGYTRKKKSNLFRKK